MFLIFWPVRGPGAWGSHLEEEDGRRFPTLKRRFPTLRRREEEA